MAHSKGLVEERLIKGTVLQRNSQSKGNKHGILKCQELATMGNIPSPCWRGQDQGAAAMEGSHCTQSPYREEWSCEKSLPGRKGAWQWGEVTP